MVLMSSARTIPPSAFLLGALGLIPFLALAVSPFALTDATRPRAMFALLVYGAVILSFLGGIHWGLAIGPGQTNLPRRLTLSVLPSLCGWLALLLSPRTGAILLAGGIIATLALDLLATRAGEAPSWYPWLRIPLSGVAAACLLFGTIG